ncbi:DUF1018 domain-containing protein [bacterium]|nr:DUF1018 domain-containing protein [bacterium]
MAISAMRFIGLLRTRSGAWKIRRKLKEACKDLDRQLASVRALAVADSESHSPRPADFASSGRDSSRVFEKIRRLTMTFFARVAIARKALGLAGKEGTDPDQRYRALLVEHFGVMSSKGLTTQADQDKLIGIFKQMGWREFTRDPDDPTWTGDKSKLGKKITALKYDLKVNWVYIHAIAKRMANVDRVQFATLDTLHSIVAALEFEKRKRRSWNAPA